MIIDADGKKHAFERTGELTELVTGKEKTFQSRTGLTFRFDINSRCALTNDSQIYVYLHIDAMPQRFRTFPILHIRGRSICFTRRVWSGKEGYDAVAPNHVKDERSVWEIGDIGLSLRQKDLDRSFVYIPLTNATQFRDRDEQELAITLIEEVLSKFNGDWIGCAHGEDQSQPVLFTPEFQEKLRGGDFVEGGAP